MLRKLVNKLKIHNLFYKFNMNNIITSEPTKNKETQITKDLIDINEKISNINETNEIITNKEINHRKFISSVMNS